MKNRTLAWIAAGFLLVAPPAVAQPVPKGGEMQPAKCDKRQAAVDRAWMLFAAKHTVSTSKEATVGARILGLSTYMLHCNVSDTKQVDLTPLADAEKQMLRQFTPAGPMGNLAKCLFDSSADETVAFVLGSDLAAYREFAESHRMGALDEEGLVKLLEHSAGCGDQVPEHLKSNELYADLNWYTRIEPNLDRIISSQTEMKS